MEVSSLLVTPWHGGLEYDSIALQRLDPAPSSYWLYPGQRQFQPTQYNDDTLRAYLQAAEQASRSNRSHRSSATLCLSPPPQFAGMPYTVAASSRFAGLNDEIALLGGMIGKLFQINHLQLRSTLPVAKTIAELVQQVQQHFQLSPACVREVEVVVTDDTDMELPVLHATGFTHLQLVLHHHTFCANDARHISRLIRLARKLHFDSVGVTLAYGGSQHTLLALARILKALLEAGPDQIALKWVDKHDPASSLPGQPDAASVAAARAQLCWCIRHLNAAQYHYLGSLIFARQEDPLVRAQIMGRLHRNLFGYTSQGENNHIGCGPGAISCLGNYYSQNHTSVDAYRQQLQSGHLPLARELRLSMDDLLRRIIIHMLLCNFELSIAALELAYPICFRHYFATELLRLKAMAQRNWLVIDDESLLVLAHGRLFITQICAIFDHYKSTADQE